MFAIDNLAASQNILKRIELLKKKKKSICKSAVVYGTVV